MTTTETPETETGEDTAPRFEVRCAGETRPTYCVGYRTEAEARAAAARLDAGTLSLSRRSPCGPHTVVRLADGEWVPA